MVGQYQPCCKRMMSVEYLDWDIEGRGVSGVHLHSLKIRMITCQMQQRYHIISFEDFRKIYKKSKEKSQERG